LKSWAPPSRTFCEAKKTGSENMTFAAATPARAPSTCAAMSAFVRARKPAAV